MIAANTTLREILDLGKEPTLKKHGVPCVSCPLAALEINKLEIGTVARIYNLNLDAILKDLNS